MNIRAKTALLLGALLLGTAACDSTSPESGSLSIKLTDAPGDFVRAVVTIDQIYLQADEDGDGGRVVLRDEDVTVDLLTLANATADLVTDAQVPAGTYSQLRFVISGGYIEVETATGTSIYASSPTYAGLPPGSSVTGTLMMPSFAQTGIKVNLPGDAVTIEGETKVLLVDFDVSRSFGQQAGQSGMWVMSPVLDASDFVTAGSVAVSLSKASSVTLPSGATLGQFKAVLKTSEGSEEELTLTDANNDGTFEGTFLHVAPGSYTLDLVKPAAVTSFGTDVTRPVAITVGSGQQVSRAFVITAAQ
jgi:hypothetical protein